MSDVTAQATIQHGLTMTTPDDPLAENRPSHWNATHAASVVMAASAVFGVFSNANAFSFGTSDAGGGNTVITGSYTVPFVPGQSVQTQPAGNIAGAGFTSTTTAGVDVRVHLKRQAGDPEWWWKHYLADPGFRYYEEVLAHQAEYDTYCSRHANQIKRYQALRKMATRLASPLYGAGVTVEQAMLDIRYSPGDLPRATAKLPNKPIEFV